MDSRARLQETLETAVSRVLRALFRVLLRHSMSYAAFEEQARRIYVEVVMKDFSISGKKPSISRASILSGLTRKEVRRLLSLNAPAASTDEADDEPPAQQEDEPTPAQGERYNRAARVLTGWVRDPDFHDTSGEPGALTIDGERGFAALVRRYSGDMPARAVLDELLRVGAVRWQDRVRVVLQTRAYVPARSAPDKIEILGVDVAGLISTIDHNIQHGDVDPRFQRKVMYQSVADKQLPAFRRLSAQQSQALLERLDGWLQSHDSDPSTAASNEPRSRVALGIYYFEEPAAPPSQGDRP